VADNIPENRAFFAYSRHFGAKGMPVPELYLVDSDERHYLQQDLGDQTLYGLLYEKKQKGGGFDAEMLALYRQALADLAAIQQAGADIDFSVAYPRAAFDRRSILWDLNYFKYHFLKLLDIPFDEEPLENDFNALADYLLSADTGYFLYRDFNPRNIMLVGSGQCVVDSTCAHQLPTTHYPLLTLYYIDYQGGRKGAAQYDVASLLYSAKSDLPDPIRRELLGHYLDVRGLKGDARREWTDQYYAYVLVRILQTLGAYGYRGLFQRKPYFLQSIPLAINNLRTLLQDHPLPITLPEIARIGKRLQEMSADKGTIFNEPSQETTLQVSVSSFSYKQGLPEDRSGNGGGHIFDCRALPNPGRYPEYKTYTGKDRPVIEFLQREEAVATFLDHAEAIVSQSVDKYLERHFTHLSVAFGCTGGQHRSVYCAEQLAARLRNRYPTVNVVVTHREQD
jgi:aminoglycoside/choline kinase family phosphotransferase